METGYEDVTLWNVLGKFFQRGYFSPFGIGTYWLLNRWRKEN